MTDDIDAHIGAKLRTMRQQGGMTQTGLGIAVGVSFQQIQKYENGKNRVSASRLYRLAKVLDTPVADFPELTVF